MDIYLGLFLFSYQSISLSFHFISSCISSDCWKSQRQQLCGNVSTIYHEIGKLRTSSAVSAWFENVQYLVVAYLRIICNISEQQITIGAWIFLFAESRFIIPFKTIGIRCTRSNLCKQNSLFFAWFLRGLRSFIFLTT